MGMNGRNLRNTAGIAGTVAAATAGALTVGLIAGVVHTASQAQQTTSFTTSGSVSTSSGGSTTSTSTRNSSTGGLGSVPQNAQPVGGSHGS
jgi:hypothetical protein